MVVILVRGRGPPAGHMCVGRAWYYRHGTVRWHWHYGRWYRLLLR